MTGRARVVWPALFLVIATGAAPVLAAERRALSLREAVALALKGNSRALQAHAVARMADARHKSHRGRLGASIDLEAGLSLWDSAFDISLADGDAGEDPPAPARIRDRLTTQVTLSATQPLTVQLIQAYELSGLERDISHRERRRLLRDVAYDTATAYIRLEQSDTRVDIARAAVGQVQAQLSQGQALHRAGMTDRNDVLKIEVAKARADSALIRAQGLQSLAQTRLALAVGLRPETVIDTTETFPDPPPSLRQGFKHVARRARTRRIELNVARAQAQMAEGLANLAFWDTLPSLAAVASYQNVQGQQFAPENSFFIGGVLQWNVWQWGASYYELQEAKHKHAVAEQAVKQLQDGVVLEVKRRHLELEVAGKILVVEKKGSAQAEEAYRIETVKYGSGSSTTTDLLDTQLALNRARLSVSNALHGWYVARVELARASGETLPWVTTASAIRPSLPGSR